MNKYMRYSKRNRKFDVCPSCGCSLDFGETCRDCYPLESVNNNIDSIPEDNIIDNSNLDNSKV